MNGQPQHKHGFILKDEGTASSVNMGDTIFQKWEKQGNRLILFGKSAPDESDNNFTDTLKIVSVNDSVMVLRKTGGQEITYSKTTKADQLVSDYETYECYAYQTKKDTAFMRLNITDGIVTGTLEYLLFEKDSNDGYLQGKVVGDTLLANYTFVSEGVESVREIVMIKTKNNWLEGFGETEEKAGSVTFKDRIKLRFRKGMLFNRIECP